MAGGTPKQVNLNADMGESYGRFVLGHDSEMIPFVRSVNVACGYHAADPGTMLRSVQLAKASGVELGAHISYPDLMGFGRRTMGLSEQEVFEISLYQIGALYGFCLAEGVQMSHVKPHGQLYLTAVHDEATARGIARAVAAVDPGILMLLYGEVAKQQCEAAGITLIQEGYVDLDYYPDGSLVLDKARKARNANQVAKNALSIAERGGRSAVDGSWLAIPARSICLHGDMDNATELASTVMRGLKEAGYEIVGLREIAAQEFGASSR